MERVGDDGMKRSMGGYALALVGVAVFVVSCFLPFYGFEGPASGSISASLVRQIVSGPGDLRGDLGGLLYLLGGAGTIAAIAAVRFVRGPRGWSSPALVAAVTVWATFWIGLLLAQSGYGFTLEVGYWSAWIGVVIVVFGTVLVLRSARSKT